MTAPAQTRGAMPDTSIQPLSGPRSMLGESLIVMQAFLASVKILMKAHEKPAGQIVF